MLFPFMDKGVLSIGTRILIYTATCDLHPDNVLQSKATALPKWTYSAVPNKYLICCIRLMEVWPYSNNTIVYERKFTCCLGIDAMWNSNGLIIYHLIQIDML